jgi:hypothetical protein
MLGKGPSLQKAPKDAYERRTEQTERKSGRRSKRNNYVDDVYDLDISAFKLNPSIDTIKLSAIPARYLNPISDLLTENGFKKISDTIPKGKYDRLRMFNDGKTEIKILYNLEDSKRGGYPIFIEINELTQEIIDLFDMFFSQNIIFPKVSQVDIAFDFYTDADPVNFLDNLNKYLFLRYQRLPGGAKGNTKYSTNLRKACKGTRTYLKCINDQWVVRLELVLKRKVINKLGLEFPLKSLDKILFEKYFIFKALDLDLIIASFVRARKDDIDKLDKQDGISGQLLIRQIESLVRSIFVPKRRWDDTLMWKLEKLKDNKIVIANYSRFLKDLTLFNQRFRKALVGKAFLPTQKKK